MGQTIKSFGTSALLTLGIYTQNTIYCPAIECADSAHPLHLLAI